MKIRQKVQKRARIEIIPMIDVIFFLLVFFMISSLSMTKINSFPVDLPQTSNHPEAIEQKIILTVNKEGSLFINRTPTTLDTLAQQLAAEMKDKPREAVIIHADEGAHYGLVIQAMDRARKIGVRKFALATEALEDVSQRTGVRK